MLRNTLIAAALSASASQAAAHGVWLAERTDRIAIVVGHGHEDAAYPPSRVRSVIPGADRCLRVLIWVAWLAITLIPTLAIAHPHVWIDVQSTFILDDGGDIAAIRQTWTFDEFYSSALLQDLKGNWKSPEVFVRESMTNLESYGYFMEVRAAGIPVALGPPQEAGGSVLNGKLTMRFTMPFQRPVDTALPPLELMVFDPTYYIDMIHVKKQPVTFEGPAMKSCSAVIEDAAPSEDVRGRAQAMNQLAVPDLSLGRLFAQIVRITCGRSD